VGASAAGLGTADALRRRGHDGPIHVLESARHQPYERPPLSKQFLSGVWTADRLAVHPHDYYDDAGIQLVLGATVTKVDDAAQFVEVAHDTGETNRMGYDKLVVATGLRARRASLWREWPGLHVLRSLDDAIELKRSLSRGSRLVVVGAGFLGTEVASVARSLGLDVALTCPELSPLSTQIGEEVALRLLRRHADEGVRIMAGVPVRGVVGSNDGVAGVVLEDGSEHPADVVLLSIGSEAQTELLRATCDFAGDGVLVDSSCRAATNVWAVGDIASRFDQRRGSYTRTEHRMNASEQGIAAAASILGIEERVSQPGYFWTNQYDIRIQACGAVGQWFESRVVDADAGDNEAIVEFLEAGRLVGVVAWNAPRAFAEHRRRVMAA
jgi:3-phenylpropionate/trans-cinnamate dioxygenase ferredoxin reductase component